MPKRKIYIDSKFKTKDSRSHSHLKFELNENLDVPDNCVCQLDNIVIPNSWLTTNNNNNNTLYVRSIQENPIALDDRIMSITPNNYSAQLLRDEVQEQLNQTYDAGRFTVTYNPDVLTLK